MTNQESFTRTDLATAQAMNAAQAIEYHYDNDTAFFALWLDPTLSYSAGRWRTPLAGDAPASTLAEAQSAKIAFHLTAAGVREGSAVLDIGCGWGAVLQAAAKRGAASALGLTLSRDQEDHVRAAAAPGVSVERVDVFEFSTDRRFDAAISIGAFEHFARPDMDRTAKIAAYRAFFDRIHAVLTPASRLSLQTIVWDAIDFDAAKKWIPQTVFPQSDLPFISEIVEGSAPTFRLVYVENDPRDYVMTLDAWLAGLEAVRGTVQERWGEAKYEFFKHYLRNSRLAFLRKKTSLARFVLERR